VNHPEKSTLPQPTLTGTKDIPSFLNISKPAPQAPAPAPAPAQAPAPAHVPSPNTPSPDPEDSKTIKRKEPKTDEQYLNIIISKLQEFFIPVLSFNNLQHELEALAGISYNSLKDLKKKLKDTQNLIKNPYGELEFASWVHEDGGQGWAIEDIGCYKHNNKVFASSFEWCHLSQVIEIPKKENKRILVIGSPVARKAESGAEAEAKVTLKLKNKEGENEQVKLIDCPYGEPVDDIVCPWVTLSLQAEIQPNCAYTAEAIFSGKDKVYWGGNFGARFGHCFAFLIDA